MVGYGPNINGIYLAMVGYSYNLRQCSSYKFDFEKHIFGDKNKLNMKCKKFKESLKYFIIETFTLNTHNIKSIDNSACFADPIVFDISLTDFTGNNLLKYCIKKRNVCKKRNR
eukprot:298719_1